jgi:hypothetical protein
MTIGFHYDKPHHETNAPYDGLRVQHRVIYAVPRRADISRGDNDGTLYQLFAATSVEAFMANRAEVNRSRAAGNPKRMHVQRVFQPNSDEASKYGCGVGLICDVKAAQNTCDRRAATNEAFAADPKADIIRVMNAVRSKVASTTKAEIDARVAARRGLVHRMVLSAHRTSSVVTAGLGHAARSVLAFASSSSPAPATVPALPPLVDAAEPAPDDAAELAQAIRMSLEPNVPRGPAARTPHGTQPRIFGARAPDPMPPPVAAPKPKPAPSARPPKSSFFTPRG